ncbi:hypothetical protein FHG66_16610 [Rubellimicrobium rubrum]|uniref:Uncharacterized protein n=1 Tax=Rubellimicrobium rubrum TaxID=2585369 RepID=A0A5C4MRC5_9RHOB|nr:hypothetical protein [Rubellimicrobium rubrum]TNC47494.1 hypothetical protein FHG66_16610 [Rubellimicrobium rubrum]
MKVTARASHRGLPWSWSAAALLTPDGPLRVHVAKDRLRQISERLKVGLSLRQALGLGRTARVGEGARLADMALNSSLQRVT